MRKKRCEKKTRKKDTKKRHEKSRERVVMGWDAKSWVQVGF